MPVSVNLTENQFETFEAATKKLTTTIQKTNKTIWISIDNYYILVEAIEKFLAQKRKIKSKNAIHLAHCYACQEILKKMESAAIHLVAEPAPKTTTITEEQDNEESES